MLLWIIFAVLTVGALIAVLWPFLVFGRGGTQDADDTAVYRDQLREIDSDLARGLIGEAEAEAARTEVSRRLLAAADSSEEAKERTAGGARRRSAAIAIAASVCVSVGSMALYLAYGSPATPDRPLAARLEAPESNQDIAALVSKVEARLREHPEDGRGWDVIAPVYLRLQRYDDAADAYERAIRLEGESTQRLVGYGEALVLGDNGVVGETARQAFEKAHERDASLMKPRFWLGMAREQDGRYEAAAETWRAMLADGPPDAPWRPAVMQRLALAENKLSGEEAVDPPASAEAPGPDREALAAAQQMSEQERRTRINRMVEGLAQRLQRDGDDLRGWLRLVRAYTVLGKREEAAQALESARENFAGNEKALAELSNLAGDLGL